MANDGTDVVPDSVSTFGQKSLAEGAALMSGTGANMGRVAAAKAGMSGLAEGVSFGSAHAQTLQALQMFSVDAATGLLALGTGAETIAQNYRNADLSQADEMSSVGSTFNAAGSTLASQRTDRAWARTDNQARGIGATAGRPEAPADVAHQPQPHAVAAEERADSGTPVLPWRAEGEGPSPQERVARHTALYGEHETWRPTAPKLVSQEELLRSPYWA